MPIWEEGIEPSETAPDQELESDREQIGDGYGVTPASNNPMPQSSQGSELESRPWRYGNTNSLVYRTERGAAPTFNNQMAPAMGSQDLELGSGHWPYGNINFLAPEADQGEGGEILDQDGVAIDMGITPTEPNSPDKLGEGMLFPER